jgi:hypothetical protein
MTSVTISINTQQQKIIPAHIIHNCDYWRTQTRWHLYSNTGFWFKPSVSSHSLQNLCENKIFHFIHVLLCFWRTIMHALDIKRTNYIINYLRILNISSERQATVSLCKVSASHRHRLQTDLTLSLSTDTHLLYTETTHGYWRAAVQHNTLHKLLSSEHDFMQSGTGEMASPFMVQDHKLKMWAASSTQY